MKKYILLCVCALNVALIMAQSTHKNYAYTNGQWYDGVGFTNATWYVSNGLLSKKAPAQIDSTIDLDGRWVIPPSGDAHCLSMSENPSPEIQAKSYITDGTFYLQVLGNTQEGRSQLDKFSGKATAPDMQFSNGAITCTLGYPFVQYEAPAMGIKNPQQWAAKYDDIKVSTKMLGNGYWFIDNKDALSANWKKIQAQKPQTIFIYLLDVANNGGKEGKGLSADMAKAIVKKAHKSDFRVIAHVETGADLALAIKLGVDGLANTPGYNWDGTGEVSKYELSDDDIKKLVKKKTPIALLFSHAQIFGDKPLIKDFHRRTLKRFLAANVNIVLGSGDTQRTTRTEFNYLFNLGVATNDQLLKIIYVQTPMSIFPNRKIAKFADGYEANFLVISANPLDNVQKSRLIAFAVKNGYPIKVGSK